MSKSASKKCKIEDEKRQFKEEWTTKYFMQHCSGAAVCLICHQSVTYCDEGLQLQASLRNETRFDFRWFKTFDDFKCAINQSMNQNL